MAQLNKADLQAVIDGLTAQVSLDELKSVLTDMNDSFYGSLRLTPYTHTGTALAEGDNTLAHNLGITIYEIYIYDTDTKTPYKPNFVTVDENEVTMTWVGTFPTNYEISFLSIGA